MSIQDLIGWIMAGLFVVIMALLALGPLMFKR